MSTTIYHNDDILKTRYFSIWMGNLSLSFYVPQDMYDALRAQEFKGSDGHRFKSILSDNHFISLCPLPA